MKALRIELTQASANYKKEETIENKMTYPLPPFSTVIGALHSICSFQEYMPMDISIQGDYHSLNKKAYVDHCFLNSTQDDRGILIKMYHPEMLSRGYQRVGSAQKKQGNSFQNNVTVLVENEPLMKEYRELKDLNDKIGEFKKGRYAQCMSKIKNRKKTLAQKKKSLEKTSVNYERVQRREKEIRQLEKEMAQRLKAFEQENYSKPISYFRTLNTSLKYYEIVSDVRLILHVRSDDKVLETTLNNIYKLKSIGRSEDFVEVVDASMVTLTEHIDREYESKYHAYLDANLIDGEGIYHQEKIYGAHASGTKYYLNKNYHIEDDKRIFEKKKVYYMSNYFVDTDVPGVYIDTSKEEPLIVNFL